MRHAHLSRRQAEASFDGVDADYDDVFAIQANTAQTADAAELAGVADLLDAMEYELVAAGRAALTRAPRFTDTRRAGRSRRRATRSALRALGGAPTPAAGHAFTDEIEEAA